MLVQVAFYNLYIVKPFFASRLTNAMLSKLLGGLGHIQALQFTGMGGPMGVYENYDTYAPRPPTPPSACEG